MNRVLGSLPRPPAGYVRRPLAAATVGVAGSLVAGGISQAFVVAAVAGALVDSLPGVVLTLGIQTMGSAAQGVGLVAALALTVLGYGLAAAVGVRLGRAFDDPAGSGLATATLVWAATALATGRPLSALGAGLPAGVVLAVLSLSGDPGTTHRPDRRRAVRALLGGLGLTGVGGVLGAGELGGAGRPPVEEVIPADERRAARRQIDAARATALDVDGLASPVSPVDEFYEVDVNTVNPEVGVGDWSLTVTGAVARERTYGYRDILELPTVHRLETLRCVGEPLNGHKMDTALWTGTPVEALLAAAGPPEGRCCVMLRAHDGYYEEFPLAALRPGLLAYGMNGGLLPTGHGFPVRALVPGHWGEINVKWLTEIEVLDRPAKGYWEKRGWHGTGPVETVAKLWTTRRDAGRVAVGGMAYAGTRGVDRVEVSTDGGATWTAATLADPLEGVDVWRQWAHRYDHPGRSHEVVVRAVDGTGAVQPEAVSDPFPSGPTGWVSTTVPE